MALFLIALAWSIWGQIDIVAVAQGRIIVRDRTKIIQPLHCDLINGGAGADVMLGGAGQVQNLVQAMAAFAPPKPGETSLSAGYQRSLNGVIAANWQ